ncbi:MAG: hypothetical protein A3H17_02095 [Candidatus Levybacteria bacterium RIFCSPLOWO2_12_FULL_37_14]|nr:MAG: hypothetical protein A3H17_02095 [Candidatus Levybacteria bacterium RIFCSPLOWO2_12_FULL_37_14]
MKKILISIIDVYQAFMSSILKNILGVNKMCRLSPTCSEYAKIAINKEGILRGLRKSAIRILSCQPFTN